MVQPRITWVVPGSCALLAAFALACSGGDLSRSDDSNTLISPTAPSFLTENSDPVAEATAAPNPAAPGETVTFDGSGSHHTDPAHAIVLYEWDFEGDGVFDATGVTATHAYPTPGSFLAVLRVTDDDTPVRTATHTFQVIVRHPDPVADAGGPYTSIVGEGLVLDGTGSFDPDGLELVYLWTIDDNPAFTYSGPQPAIPWTDLSDLPIDVHIDVGLRVTNTRGANGTARTTLQIHQNQPVAQATAIPNPAEPGEMVTFDGSGSYHTHPERAIVLYEWDFEGDGAFDATGVTATHAYPAPGSFQAVLRVTDDNTPVRTAIRTFEVVVEALPDEPNDPPVPDAGGPYSGAEGAAVAFDGSGSSDPDGDPLTYDWDFGDGTTATGVAPSHVYADNGSYTVTLTISDGEATRAATAQAEIANVAPTVDAGPDVTLTAGQSFTLSGAFADPGAEDGPWVWTVDFGGSSATGTASDPAAPITPTSHTYVTNSTVRLTVTDRDGDSGSDDLTVTVAPQEVAIDIRPGEEPNSIRLGGGGRGGNGKGQGKADDAGAKIPVAIFGSTTFDPATVDPATVTLGDGTGQDTPVARKNNGAYFASFEDVDGDGRAELVLHFARADLIDNGDLIDSTTSLTLLGELYGGAQFAGTDSVVIVPSP